MTDLEKMLKVIADKNRLRIIKLLETRKMCVCELAYAIGVTQPSISRHLKKMKDVGLVGDEQDGFWTNYYLCKKPGLRVDLLHIVMKHLKADESVRAAQMRLKNIKRTEICCK